MLISGMVEGAVRRNQREIEKKGRGRGRPQRIKSALMNRAI
jgi:hypothetical protein